MLEHVNEELLYLECVGVLCPVRTSEWAAPIVAILKWAARFVSDSWAEDSGPATLWDDEGQKELQVGQDGCSVETAATQWKLEVNSTAADIFCVLP